MYKKTRFNTYIGSYPIKRLSPYIFNLLLALITWSIWFYFTSPLSWELVEKHWLVSVTMIFGSFVAGATSEGGGAIAFPIFTKVLQIAPVDAKVFSLAIQSIGMSAASIAILMMRINVLWRVIVWSSLGGVLGLLIGMCILSAVLPPTIIRLLFTVMAVSLGLTLLYLNTGFRPANVAMPEMRRKEIAIFLMVGILGGILSGLVGSGIDMLCFTVLVLLFRISESVATPTSVILMAIHSIFGVVLQFLLLEGINMQVQSYWLAAVPVVVVGAPLGAFFCSRLQNQHIRYLLIALIVVELCSSLWVLTFDRALIGFSVSLLLMFSSVMFWMSKSTVYAQQNNQDVV